MKQFHKIEEATAIIRSRGKFKQVDVYRRGVRLFVEYSGGYAMLMANGGTSIPNLSCIEFSIQNIGYITDPIYGPKLDQDLGD